MGMKSESSLQLLNRPVNPPSGDGVNCLSRDFEDREDFGDYDDNYF